MSKVVLRSLPAHRSRAGLSQRQLAKHAGISAQNIRRLERDGDAGEVTLAVLARLADTLRITMADLLTEAETSTPAPRATESLTLTDARVLRKIATKLNASATLKKHERELIIPRLMKAGLVIADGDGLHLHPDVASTLMQ